MKTLIFLGFGLALAFGGFALAETEEVELLTDVQLTEEYQQDLLDRLNHLHNHGPVPASLEGLEHPICGTGTVLEATLHQDRFSPAFKAAVTDDPREPSLTLSYGSPEGYFLLHYVINGTDAIYSPLTDTLYGGDGIPDYINKVAEIADSVWEFEINVIGFPAPPSDGPYDSDPRYDIYILNLGSSYYGATYNETPISNQQYTSTIKLDNDYNFAPYNEFNGDPRDFNRRLDAVRVTMAHEFNHSIQFGMDWSEYELDPGGYARIPFWEMSAVFMEELMYDDINDYYGYIMAYLRQPWKGLRFFLPGDLFPYGAGIFPIFLWEQLGDSTITRKFWERARDKGVGFHFVKAIDEILLEGSDSTYGLRDAMNDFAVWNVFTGSRASRAPAGFGYSERANYPTMPDSVFFRFEEYPVNYYWDTVAFYFAAKRPEIMSTNYIDFRNVSLVSDSFTFYFSYPTNYPISQDSSAKWNISLIGLPLDGVSAGVVNSAQFLGPIASGYKVPDHFDYLRIIAVPSVASTRITETNYTAKYNYAFFVVDTVAPGDTLYVFSHPFPNPFIMGGADDEVTFQTRTPVTEINAGELQITIFNAAGEKVRELPFSPLEGQYLVSTWDLKNESGNDVAAGVYLAYMRLKFYDNRPEVIQKYKLVVFK